MRNASKLYVIGIGPGDYRDMTIRAHEALLESSVIAGYSVYVDLIKDRYEGKEFITTAMRQESQRCEMAFKKAMEGKIVALVCSGDAGVYGMASLVLELSPLYPEVIVEIIPGVTAALSGSAVLGAPISHDFAVISLSDLLTSWSKIEERLHAAGKGDFCIAIYNPSSKKRADYLQKACDILLKYKSPATLCGYVRNIGRDGEEKVMLTLERLRNTEVDMFTTVFIGNSETREISQRLVTPRGYKL